MRRHQLIVAIAFLFVVTLCPGHATAQNKLPVTVVSAIGEPYDPDSAALSPNGKLIATWDSVQAVSVTLWDVASGRPLRMLRHSALFQSVVFSADGRLIASAHKDGNVKLWDAASGSNLATFLAGPVTKPHDDVDAVSSLWIDPKGAVLVAGSRGGLVTTWDIAKRKRIASFTWPAGKSGERPVIVAARLTTDGTGLIVLASDALKIVDARTNKQRQSVTPPENYKFSESSILSDGEFVLRYSGPKCKLDPVFMFDLKEVTRLIYVDVPAQCDIAPNEEAENGEVHVFADQAGRKLVVARDGIPGLKVWDLKSRSPDRSVAWPDDAAARVAAFSADLTSAVVHEAGRLRIRRFDSGAAIRELTGFGYPAETAILSRDERQIILPHRAEGADTGTKDIGIWQIDEGSRTVMRLKAEKGTSIDDVSPEAKLAVGGTEQGEIVLFSTETGTEVRRFAVPGLKSVDRARLLADGRMILVLGDDAERDTSSAAVVGAQDGKVMLSLRAEDPEKRPSSHPFSIAVSRDGKTFAVGSRDGSVDLRSSDGLKRIRLLPAAKSDDEPDIRTLSFSSDGRFVIGGSLFDADAFLWDASSGRLLRSFELDTVLSTYPYVSAPALSRDGKLVAGGLGQRHISSGDTGVERGGIALWDAATGKLRTVLRGHLGAVYAITFSPDDRRIVSASLDGTIRYWDRASGRPLATFSSAPDGRWIVTTESGFFAGPPESADLINLVRGLEARPGSQFRDQLHRPDLVRELLRGDPEGRYRDAAQKLDLEKIWNSAAAQDGNSR